MGEIKFVGSLILVALFATVITLFAINFSNDNGAAFSVENQPGFNDTANLIKSNLSTFRTQVVNSSDSFYKSEIQDGETVRTGGQFKVGPSTALRTTEQTARQGFRVIFGDDSQFGFILTALLGFLTFVLILLIWKTWGGRNPE